MTQADPEKLRVLWKKGRNYFQTFFVELAAVRKSIGDDVAFTKWCLTELRIGPTALGKVSGILVKADSERVKQDLREASERERQKKREERAELARQKAEQKAERERVATERKAAKEQRAKERKRLRRNKRDRVTRRRRKRNGQMTEYAAVAERPYSNLSDSELAHQIKEEAAGRERARSQWIEHSIKTAALLYEARSRLSSNLEFSEWLDRHGIEFSKNDRAALVNLGSNTEAMRATLKQTDRVSYQLIWGDVQRQIE